MLVAAEPSLEPYKSLTLSDWDPLGSQLETAIYFMWSLLYMLILNKRLLMENPLGQQN